MTQKVNMKDLVSKMRGFNLTDMFVSENSTFYERVKGYGSFGVKEFRLIHDMGFNFIRVPLSYRIWGSSQDPFYVDENKLNRLDNLVENAEKYNMHINLAFHRAPGYCVNEDEAESLNLWADQQALDAFKYHFHRLAERYRHLSLDRLSYNVINEPSNAVSSADYSRVCESIIDEVRHIDPDRYFMIDGLSWGRDPHFAFLRSRKKNMIYSCRGYDPMGLTHFGTVPERDSNREKPTWPEGNLNYDGVLYGTEELKQDMDFYGAIRKIYDVPVICGELGVFRGAPHQAALAWLDDLLKYLSMNKIGWAMWNFVGNFGVLNSGRTDVDYEDFHGYQLDRKMLNVMLKYI